MKPTTLYRCIVDAGHASGAFSFLFATSGQDLKFSSACFPCERPAPPSRLCSTAKVTEKRFEEQRVGAATGTSASKERTDNELVERILFFRAFLWGCKFECLEHWYSGWRLDSLSIALGQSVVRLEAKDLLLSRGMAWQPHAIDVLRVRVEADVMQVRSSMQPVVV